MKESLGFLCYVFVRTQMAKLNPALFEPLTRIENACRRASNIMLTAPTLPPQENELVLREIQEIREALEAFKAAG